MATTKARGEAAVLVAVVFLLGILLGGVGNHLWGERVWGMRDTTPPPNHLSVELTQELQLTPDQQKQINGDHRGHAGEVARSLRTAGAAADGNSRTEPRSNAKNPHARASAEIRRVHAPPGRTAQTGRGKIGRFPDPRAEPQRLSFRSLTRIIHRQVDRNSQIARGLACATSAGLSSAVNTALGRR